MQQTCAERILRRSSFQNMAARNLWPILKEGTPLPFFWVLIGNLSKPRRQRQRQRRQTEGLMSKTIAVRVRYKSLYISLPFSAKQQRGMTKFCVVWRT